MQHAFTLNLIAFDCLKAKNYKNLNQLTYLSKSMLITFEEFLGCGVRIRKSTNPRKILTNAWLYLISRFTI